MKDQHTKITGYRDLSESEIKLMNKIKDHGEVTKKLLKEVWELRLAQSILQDTELTIEQHATSMKCIDTATTSLQTGQMWFVRAVALPDSF